MEFNLRTLKTSDMFPMFQILNKIGFKEIKDRLTPEKIELILSKFSDEEKQEKTSVANMTTIVGFNIVMEIAGVILDHLPSIENDLYVFLSGVSGIKQKDLSNLPPADFMELIILVLQKEEFVDFFKVVSRLFK